MLYSGSFSPSACGMPPLLYAILISSSLCLTLSTAYQRGIVVFTPPPHSLPVHTTPVPTQPLRHGSGFANGRRNTGQPTSRYTQCQQILSRSMVGSTDRCRSRSTVRGFEGSFGGSSTHQRFKRVSFTVRQRCPRWHRHRGTRGDILHSRRLHSRA